MKNRTKLFVLPIMMLWSTITANADVYKLDFNTVISTTNHDFKVADGWGHIVDGYIDYEDGEIYYVKYSYSATDGIDGSGALKVGDQTTVGSGSSWETGPTTDLLVTPKITGKASIYVKQTSSSGTVKFYTVTREGDKYKRGAQISIILPTLSCTDYVKVELPALTGAYVGIYGSNVIFDNFEAESIESSQVKALTIQSAVCLNKSTTDCRPDGKFPIAFTVKIKNSGNVDLHPGDEGFSISVLNHSLADTVVFTVPIGETLQAEQTVTVDVSGEAPYADFSKRGRYDVKENISGSTKFGAWIDPVPYAPKMSLRDKDGIEAGGKTFAFGMINQPKTLPLIIRNSGAAPLKVTGISLPEHFSSSLEAPFTMAAHLDTTLVITLKTDIPGIFGGQITINGEGVQPVSATLSGTVIDPTKFFVTFEDKKLPSGSIAETNWTVEQHDYASSTNAYFLSNSVANEETKFITPLLKVAQDEKFSVDVAKVRYSSNESFLNIYYSPDRKTWTLARAVENSELSSKRASVAPYYNSELCTFVIDNIPAGQYYIGFGAGYSAIDNIYGFEPVPVKHDWMLVGAKLPTSGSVNHAYTATATLRNINARAEETDSYKATLYVDGKTVAKAPAVELAAGTTTEFRFSYTPTTVGSHRICIEFSNEGDGYLLRTDTVEMTISPETGSQTITVGEAEGTINSSPLSLNYKQSETESIYTAEQLGLTAGDKITSMVWRGYKTTDNLTTHLEVLIGNTAETSVPVDLTTVTEINREGMTKVYDADYTFLKKGSDTDLTDLLAIKLTKPFEYTGGSLRIIVKSIATQYRQANFEKSTVLTGQCYGRQHDTNLDGASFVAKPLPIIVLGKLLKPAQISGTITSNGKPVPNAMLTLMSGDVKYSSKTNATGRYSVDVVQTALSYSLSTSADGYADYSSANLLFKKDSVLNIELSETPITVSINSTGWTAFSSTRAIDFSTISTLKAYIVTKADDATATLKRVEIVPAYTAVLLRGAEGSYELQPISEAIAPAVNILQNTVDAPFTVGDAEFGKAYALGTDNGITCFVRCAKDSTILRRSGYLLLNIAPTTNLFTLDYMTDATEHPISHSEGISLDPRKPMYNLSGQRVGPTYRGIVIQHGKKFINK